MLLNGGLRGPVLTLGNRSVRRSGEVSKTLKKIKKFGIQKLKLFLRLAGQTGNLY
jgi:hypothetical protein